MTTLATSEAALASVRKMALAYQLRKPVLCVIRQAAGIDFVRGEGGQPIRIERNGGWLVTLEERGNQIGYPLPSVPWHGLELICEGSADPTKQLHLDVADGDLQIEERTI